MIKNYFSSYIKKNLFISILFSFAILTMLFNVFNYYHELGYDGQHHKYNIEVLPLNLPTPEDTKEFFNPPLPYLVSSIVDKVCDRVNNFGKFNYDCGIIYGNIGQLFQVILFAVILIFFIKICSIIAPQNNEYKKSALILFLLPAVNYKTFAMIRGEAYVSFFMFIFLYHFMKIIKSEEISKKDLIINSLLIGLIGLSKQWGLLMFPAIGIISLLMFKYKDKKFSINHLRYTIKSFLYSFLIYGWFYISLFINYGSITAFNRPPSKFLFSNQPSSFYFELALADLFVRPIRGFTLTNKLFPVLYADTWGDYWGYFLVTMGKGDKFNYEIVPYLGYVNLFALIPTLIIVIGILYSIFQIKKLQNNNKIFYLLIFMIVVFTWIGYLWFLIKYPNPAKGDTIKSTYIISLIHLLPFFGANLLDTVKKKSYQAYNIIFYLLLAVFIFNIPTYYSRFSGIYT